VLTCGYLFLCIYDSVRNLVSSFPGTCSSSHELLKLLPTMVKSSRAKRMFIWHWAPTHTLRMPTAKECFRNYLSERMQRRCTLNGEIYKGNAPTPKSRCVLLLCGCCRRGALYDVSLAAFGMWLLRRRRGRTHLG